MLESGASLPVRQLIMKTRAPILILLVATLAFLQTPSVLTQLVSSATYVVADLGALGGTTSEAYGINESG
jgi:hypothetical protein